MFAEYAIAFIQQAVKEETAAAVEKWGREYSSMHEGYAVLKEEVEEAAEEMAAIIEKVDVIWHFVKSNNPESIKHNVESIKELALNLASEAVQIAAVSTKIQNTIEESNGKK